MRRIKKVGEYLVVRFNERERREREALGAYGIIQCRLYTGVLDVDLHSMDFDGLDTLEEAVQQARGLIPYRWDAGPPRLQKAFALACRLLGGEDGQRIQREILARVDGEPVCRVCGCTEYDPCPGGCFWVGPDLCSACAGARKKTRHFGRSGADSGTRA